MHFNPACLRRLFREDGASIPVKSFGFKASSVPEIEWEYHTADGRRLLCVDRMAGIFAFVDTGERLYLVSPAKP